MGVRKFEKSIQEIQIPI